MAEKFIGGYVLEKALAPGVFRGYENTSGDAVILKVPNIKLFNSARDPQKAAYFTLVRENAILSDLPIHPHVVKRREFVMGATPALVLEDAGHESLFEVGYLDHDTVSQYLHQAAQGLAHIHKHGFVHRDVKPHNVVRNNGHVTVIDLGAAVNDLSSEATDSYIYGTPAFMAPEQCDGAVDKRSDIFGLAATFYQLVTGGLPYQIDFASPDGRLKYNDPQYECMELAELGYVGYLLLDALDKNPDNRPPLEEIIEATAREPIKV
jgi:serine/threonine protein kinase